MFYSAIQLAFMRVLTSDFQSSCFYTNFGSKTLFYIMLLVWLLVVRTMSPYSDILTYACARPLFTKAFCSSVSLLIFIGALLAIRSSCVQALALLKSLTGRLLGEFRTKTSKSTGDFSENSERRPRLNLVVGYTLSIFKVTQSLSSARGGRVTASTNLLFHERGVLKIPLKIRL